MLAFIACFVKSFSLAFPLLYCFFRFFACEVSFYISFYLDSMQEMAVNFLIKNRNIRLANEEFDILQASVFEEQLLFGENEIIETDIETLSPIVAYRTQKNVDKKYTMYFKPTEREFSEILKQNLERKMDSLGISENNDFFFCPVKYEFPKGEAVVKYKGTIIKGHSGRFLLKCSKKAFSFLYHSGLGSKNSQGFGMIKII